MMINISVLVIILAMFNTGAFAADALKSAAGVSAVVPAAVPAAVAEEKADPHTWDFGKINATDPVQHEFELTNTGKEKMTILSVNTSCGCTASQSAKKELMPGESTKIAVKFNPKNYSGPVKQYVYVRTDSLDNQLIRFIIKADVFSVAKKN